MKSNRFVKGLLGPIVVGLLGLVLGSTLASCSPKPAAQAQAPKKGPVWEYAELSYFLDDNDKAKVSFATGEKYIEEADFAELAKKMQLKPTEKSEYLVFDHLGAQGWEMFSAGTIPISGITNGNGGTQFVEEYWLFKRVRP